MVSKNIFIAVSEETYYNWSEKSVLGVFLSAVRAKNAIIFDSKNGVKAGVPHSWHILKAGVNYGEKPPKKIYEYEYVHEKKCVIPKRLS